MPAALMSKDDMLARLMALFREKGFDGASLADISAATGLGKSSLYHHFPDGKAEMAQQVLGYLEAQLEVAIFEPLRSTGSPRKKLDRMLDALDRFYDGGKRACLLERLCASVDAKRFRRPLGRASSGCCGAASSRTRASGSATSATSRSCSGRSRARSPSPRGCPTCRDDPR